MALFDFPRINFNGDLDINVPTINNSVYFPLTIYDQMRSEPLFPPRLYFSSEAVINGVKSDLKPLIHKDDLNGYVYIVIEPINTIKILRTWCMTPVGQAGSPDIAYVPYYDASLNDLGKQNGMPITGSAPGYWNMYGDMGVKMSNCQVSGIHTFDGKNLKLWTGVEPNMPPEIEAFLDSAIDLDTTPASGISTAMMVETISSQSVYANIFCSNINFYKKSQPDQIYFQGNPFRFGALIYSAWKVLNWMPPMAGSGRFNTAVPLEEINSGEQSKLIQFFEKYSTYDNRKLKGVFVSFVVTEVFENRYDQNIYIENGTKSNPAQCKVFGSITPWYDGDMKTGVPGRNLISLGQEPWYVNTNSVAPHTIPIACAPATASMKDLGNGTAILSIDMGNTWPEAISPVYSSGFQPTHRGQVSFETMELGTLKLKYGITEQTEICRIDINPSANSLNSIYARGGIFDFILSDPNLIKQVNQNFLSGFLSVDNKSFQIMKESEFMFCSDQKGLYTEQGDTPTMGYHVNDANREPCRLRIFQYGKPVTNPVEILMAEYIVPEAGNDPINVPNSITRLMLADNDIVPLADSMLSLKNNAIYYFVYNGQYPDNSIPAFVINNNYTIMDTGSFVLMRVHPHKDFSKYIDKNRPDYTPPTFDVVYEEVFKLYDVVYPVMALILPFTEEVWNNGTMAGMVLQRTDPKLWNNVLYMPRSRELSRCQRELLQAWANTFTEQ